jgi:acetyl-CoA acyltransferase 1
VTSNASKPGQKHPDDIVIVSALRTMLGRARRGGLKDVPVEELLAAVLKATIDRTKIDPALIGDIVVGSVLGNGSQRANECRIAAFFAGLPDSVPVHTVNRQCSSGLQALAHVAANINAGYYEIGIAAGVESMSKSAMAFEVSRTQTNAYVDSIRSCDV